MTVCIRGRLREDCLDKHIQRIESLLERWDAVHGSEILNRISDSLPCFRGRIDVHSDYLALPGSLMQPRERSCDLLTDRLGLSVVSEGAEMGSMIDTVLECLR